MWWFYKLADNLSKVKENLSLNVMEHMYPNDDQKVYAAYMTFFRTALLIIVYTPKAV